MFIKKIIVFIITFSIFILFSAPMFVYASDDILSCDIQGGGSGSFVGGSTEHESSSGDIHGGTGGSFDDDKSNKTDIRKI